MTPIPVASCFTDRVLGDRTASVPLASLPGELPGTPRDPEIAWGARPVEPVRWATPSSTGLVLAGTQGITNSAFFVNSLVGSPQPSESSRDSDIRPIENTAFAVLTQRGKLGQIPDDRCGVYLGRKGG